MRSIKEMQRRIMMVAARGVLKLVNDGLKLQGVQAQVYENEVRADVERFQNYGVTSNPLVGAECIVLALGGSKDHTVVIAVDDRRYRLKSLAPGEVAIYTDEGDKIHLKRGNLIEVTTGTFTVNASTKVRFNTPMVEASGDIIDKVSSGGRTLASTRAIFNSHVHPETNAGNTLPSTSGM